MVDPFGSIPSLAESGEDDVKHTRIGLCRL
jgi:hypothetical protein